MKNFDFYPADFMNIHSLFTVIYNILCFLNWFIL